MSPDHPTSAVQGPGTPTIAVVLAAGQGTRMSSNLPKVLHRVAGRTMVDRVLSTLEASGIPRIVVVVGFGRTAVEDELRQHHPEAVTVVQEEQLGTGHAVASAMPALDGVEGVVAVFSGDTPLLEVATVRGLWTEHARRGASATILTARLSDPSGYGRVVRDDGGMVERIIEEKDADDSVRTIREINAGAYIFQPADLRDALGGLDRSNVQGEFYLTDTIGWLRSRGKVIAAHLVGERTAAVLGVNTSEQLEEAERLLREKGSD